MKTAIITGGSRGIGAAAVSSFARAGYRVAFCYHQNQKAAATVAEKTGALAFPCDMGDSLQVNRFISEVLSSFHHIDVLVHNAGISQQKLFTDITDEDWRRMFAVHVDGGFYAARAVLPSMISQKSGRILFLSSMWGQTGGSMEVSYSAAKAALIGMTRALAKEVAPSGICVNCVSPGVISTDMLADFNAETLSSLRNDIPLGRLGTPEDIAKALLWLCSEDACYITGQVLGVNGGLVTG